MMKKLLSLLTALLLIAAPAMAEFDLSAMSPAELQTLIEQAQSQLELSEEKLIAQAINELKQVWLTNIYSPDRYTSNDGRGYLEIVNTCVTYVKHSFATQAEYAAEPESMFRNVYCVIDFILLSDYFGSAPYYSDIGLHNSVVVYLDGSMEVSAKPLFDLYRSRSFVSDFSPIIESVHDLSSAYDAIYYLLEE